MVVAFYVVEILLDAAGEVLDGVALLWMKCM